MKKLLFIIVMSFVITLNAQFGWFMCMPHFYSGRWTILSGSPFKPWQIITYNTALAQNLSDGAISSIQIIVTNATPKKIVFWWEINATIDDVLVAKTELTNGNKITLGRIQGVKEKHAITNTIPAGKNILTWNYYKMYTPGGQNWAKLYESQLLPTNSPVMIIDTNEVSWTTNGIISGYVLQSTENLIDWNEETNKNVLQSNKKFFRLINTDPCE